MVYLNIRIKDDEETIILKHFQSCHQFIDSAVEKNQKVLIQCALGISRSATIVVSYLMKKNNWSLQKAYKYVKDLRFEMESFNSLKGGGEA
jgi:protein-tyrosine phosphatase